MTERLECVVLDSQGLSAWVTQDRKVMARMRVFHRMGVSLVVVANTIVERSATPE